MAEKKPLRRFASLSAKNLSGMKNFVETFRLEKFFISSLLVVLLFSQFSNCRKLMIWKQFLLPFSHQAIKLLLFRQLKQDEREKTSCIC